MSARRTRWGYHQLVDSYARALVRHARLDPSDVVVDIGAGSGALTRHLLATGARVIAVERHAGRASTLRSRFAGTRLRVLEIDLSDWRPPATQYRVVANPPFGCTATVLRAITAPRSRLVQADLVLPGYLAARWARGAGYRCPYDAHIACRLPQTAFEPAATQPTAVLRLSRIGLS